MSISAQRFKYLDKETNIPIKDFTSLNDNSVYSLTDSIIESNLALTSNSDTTLNALQGSLKDLDKISIDDIPNVSEMVNSVVKSLKGMNLPSMSTDILDSISSLNESGMNSFFKDILKIGSKLLCNNREFLKMFMAGYSLNKNVGQGLLFGLLFALLDQFCTQMSNNEIKKSSKLDILNSMFPYKGMNLNNGNVLGLFKGYYSDHLKSQQPLTLQSNLDSTALITSIVNATTNTEVRTMIANLSNYELTNQDKDIIYTKINAELLLHLPSTGQYQRLLYAKGELNKVSLVSSERRTRSVRYGNLNDRLGSMMSGIGNIDFSSSSFFNLTGSDAALSTALRTFQQTSNTSNVSRIRSTNSGSFNNVNFSSILPPLDPSLTNELITSSIETDSHRLYDIHPTAEVFLC